MEDDYELISKEYIQKLKDENLELKEKNSKLEIELKKYKGNSNDNQDINNNKIDSDLTENSNLNNSDIKEIDQNKKQDIFKELNIIRELNEKILSAQLSKSTDLDYKLDQIITSMKSTLESLGVVINEISDVSDLKLNIIIDKISKETIKPLKIEDNMKSFEQKLKDVDLFMQNLRVLLSYVKPTDITIDKPSDKL